MTTACAFPRMNRMPWQCEDEFYNTCPFECLLYFYTYELALARAAAHEAECGSERDDKRFENFMSYEHSRGEWRGVQS